MPELNSTVQILSPNFKEIISVQGGWDVKVDAYIDECIFVYDTIFAELNNLIERTGYFKKKKKGE